MLADVRRHHQEMITQGMEQGRYLRGPLRKEFHLRRKTKAGRKAAARCGVDKTVCAHDLLSPFSDGCTRAQG